MTTETRASWPRRIWLILGLAAMVCSTAGAVVYWSGKHSKAAASLSARRPSRPRLSLNETAYPDILQQIVYPSVNDPQSPEHIRDCYLNAGYRLIDRIEKHLAQSNPPLEQRLGALFVVARLCLHEGDFKKASSTFEEVRVLAEQYPDETRFEEALPTLIFLQGIAAMRQGETENCVECPCESSCVFPISSRAVHAKREGSTRAIKFFTEYLELFPDDMGVRWLLNLAYMTLGEYPDHVPTQYLVPLEPFRSEVDIGRFTDIAPSLGLNRLNQAGGAIMDDFDNDGLLDIAISTMDTAGPMALYRNQGDGTFQDRSEASGLSKILGGLNCVQTDYNNDGWLDIYVMRGGWQRLPQRHSLLRNNKDGTFTDVTKEAGINTPIDGQVAVWADYDNDGFLDLFVGGESTRCRLYHNRGDGTFEEVAVQAGVANEGGQCKGANWGDFNGDRYPDLYVANLNGPPRLYRNNRDGTFTDVAKEMGIKQPTNGFSCWFWDYDNDGWLDLFATSYEQNLSENIKSHLGMPHEGTTCRLYRNRGGKGFDDVSEAVGLNLAMAPMGSNFVDLDNDGYLDIYLGTGTQAYSLLVPNRMFKNMDGKRFVDITTSSGTGHLQKGHGVACGDWDRDGNVDMFVELGGATPGDRFRNVLYQNPGHKNHWITVKLIGKKTNRPAIGARIKATVEAGGSTRAIYRHVTSGSSFGGNALQQTIGVGKADKIVSLEVYWPTSDSTQVFRDVPVNQAIEVTEFAQDYRRLNWQRIPWK
jgi:tetratricopeptide (TPR) repeat protein